ncbi:MFS transporter [bacterium]|nr:MFS transporter [bacterium]
MTVYRLLAINGLIRISAAGSGQLFAFLLADRMSGQAGMGSILVGVIGAAFFVTEMFGAPFAGGLADRLGHLRILRWGPVFGIISAITAASVVLGSSSIVLLVIILFFARLNEGASAAFSVPTTLTLLSRITDGEVRRRTRVMGAFEITSLVGMIAGYVVVGIAWDVYGSVAFLVLPPLYAIAWWLARARQPEIALPSSGNQLANSETASFSYIRTLLVEFATDRKNLAFGISWLSVNAVVGLWL